MIKVEYLAEVLVEITDTLVDDVDPVEFLRLVSTRSAVMSQSLWAGVLLADPPGRLQLLAASEESAALRELFELEDEEGPGLDCFRMSATVVNADLAGDRWPVFGPRAVSAGFRSVSAFPLRGRNDVVGAMSLFSSEPGHLEPRDVRIVQALADIVTIGLLRERSLHDGVIEAMHFQRSLRSRITAEQAKGALARTQGVTVDEAADLIRDYATRNHQDVAEVTEAVLAKPDLIEPQRHTLLTPAEVASMFRVDPKTITRWARAGQLNAVRTLGGHRRYRYHEVTRLLEELEVVDQSVGDLDEDLGQLLHRDHGRPPLPRGTPISIPSGSRRCPGSAAGYRPGRPGRRH